VKIRKMTATFGCLDNCTLELSDGVQILTLPNEGGKTTWTEFILSMFYGLDPRRSSKGRLSHKERFTPWNGKPMEGLLELEMEGRTVVLQRTSTGSKPFGNFKAWDKRTGMEIRDLTAENCGRTLLGVEREVFRRSAFLSGTQLMVTPENDLSRRLESLAATGRQTDSFLQADQTLHTWQNRLRYNKSGEIPKLERKLQELSEAREQMPPTEHLPSYEELMDMMAVLKLYDPRREKCPEPLEGLEGDEIVDKARRDVTRRTVAACVWFCLGLLIAAAGVLLKTWFFLPGAVPVFLIWLGCVRSKKLLRRYGVKKHSQIVPLAVRWQESRERKQECKRIIAQVREFSPFVRTAEEALDAVAEGLELHKMAEQAAAIAPDPEEVAQLQEQVERLRRRELAITLARKALNKANTILQENYVPRLTGLAGQYLKELTLGRYDGLIMNENMELSVCEHDGKLRPLAAVSTGTQDETWLALRLAMTRLLLPEGSFMVFDDVFMTFDEQREEAAIRLLDKENRQVLIFSCK